MISLFVKDLKNNLLYELPFISITPTEELNVGMDATITLDLNAVNEVAERYGTTALFLLTSSTREIWVEKDGKKLYYGVISDFGLDKNDQGSYQISLASVGFFSLLTKRRTGPKRIFTSTDAGSIAWTLIDESQQSEPPYSDLGITQGLIQESKQRDRTFRFDNIKDQIVDMSNRNLNDGFDFDIDNSKKFNVYYPQKGQQRKDIVFDDGNIDSWSFRKPMVLSLTNKVYVVGSGMNDDVLYTVRNSADIYKSAFGLLEDALMERQIETEDTLIDKGDRHLRDNQAPINDLTITHTDGSPDIFNYEVGDSFRVSIPEIGLNGVYKRVMKRAITITGEGRVTATLTLK